MSKIIYALSGQGFGHSSRSHVIGQYLLDSGHDVMFAASGQGYQYLLQYFPERTREISGFHFVYRNGALDGLKTVIENAIKLPRIFRKNYTIFKQLFASFVPELVITDFEPFSAWWALLNGVPYISVDHQHMLTMCRFPPPPNTFLVRLPAWLITKCYYAGAKQYVILNFFKTALSNKKAILLPPVIRKAACLMEPESGQHIIFYSTDCSYFETLPEILNQFPAQSFKIYGLNKAFEHGNCEFIKTSTETFIRDLASSKAVIATAGFSLISECLFFGKKMLLLPLRTQYEQMVNAFYIETLGAGMSAERLDHDVIETFLNWLRVSAIKEELILRPDNKTFFLRFEALLREVLKRGFKTTGQVSL